MVTTTYSDPYHNSYHPLGRDTGGTRKRTSTSHTYATPSSPTRYHTPKKRGHWERTSPLADGWKTSLNRTHTRRPDPLDSAVHPIVETMDPPRSYVRRRDGLTISSSSSRSSSGDKRGLGWQEQNVLLSNPEVRRVLEVCSRAQWREMSRAAAAGATTSYQDWGSPAGDAPIARLLMSLDELGLSVDTKKNVQSDKDRMNRQDSELESAEEEITKLRSEINAKAYNISVLLTELGTYIESCSQASATCLQNGIEPGHRLSVHYKGSYT